jgi:predicted permease
VKSALTRLLRFFPAAFREQFGAEMAEQIASDYDCARSRGRLDAFAFSLLTGWDLVRSSLTERWRPTWADRTPATAGETTMTTLGNIWMDGGYALRALRRSPRFTALAVGTLALALGALAGLFNVVDALLLRPLPYANTDRLVYVAASVPGATNLGDEFGASPEFYLQYQQASLLEGIAAYGGGTNTLRVGDRAERVPMSMPSPDLFQTLGVNPILGRMPVPEDNGRVALISHGLWTTWFGSDPLVIGRSFEMAGEVRTVIGVMGPDFWFPNRSVQLWLPYGDLDGLLGTGAFGMGLVARVRPGSSQEALADELARLALRIPERFGGEPTNAFRVEQHRPVVRPLEEHLEGSAAGTLWVLLCAAGIVLLIACANVANLFMVRGERRQRDHAVRRALGGTRARLIRAGLAEALGVALLAGVFATLVAQASVPLFSWVAPDFAQLGEVRLSTPTVLVTLAASVLSALACGLIPALRASSPRLTNLREAGRGSTGRRRWVQDGLLVAQTALALVLLIGSALLVKSFRALHGLDLGFEAEDVFTFQFAPEGADLVDGPSYARLHLEFMERVAALPGVESVGVVNNVPLDEGVNPGVFVGDANAARPGAAGTLLSYTYAGGDYFTAMGIDVKRGRAFRRADHVSEPGNVVISNSAAQLVWPGEDPVGRRMRRVDGDDWFTVVGVVEDVVQSDFGQASPLVYFPLVGPTPTSWSVTSPGYVVKTARAEEIAPEIRELVHRLAPGAPMYATHTMRGLAAREMMPVSSPMLVLGAASVLALILGIVGLYGVLSYVVAQRNHEIGIRIALGAGATRVQGMVVLQGARVVAIGVAIGVGVAIASTHVLSGLLFGVEPVDAVAFVGVSGAMVLVGLLASWVPARRAARVDPMLSLRAD